MSAQNPFQRYNIRNVLHFTDERNLPSIRKHGGLYSRVELRRRGIKVAAPGGNDWSQEADEMSGMDEYVHLCFKFGHPMEYRARQEGRIINPVYLEIDLSVLDRPGVRFTPGVSNKSGMPIYSINEAMEMIDFEVLYTRTNWKDPAIQERLQAAEKCEILVPTHLPLRYIRNLANG